MSHLKEILSEEDWKKLVEKINPIMVLLKEFKKKYQEHFKDNKGLKIQIEY